MAPKKYWRLDPAKLVEREIAPGAALVIGPGELVAAIKPGHGIVLAAWDEERQLGVSQRLGVVRAIRGDQGAAEIAWVPADHTFRPSPSGRQFWKQQKPFFGFAAAVVDKYMLASLFEDVFPDYADMSFGAAPPRARAEGPRPSSSPTGGYVYVIKSPHGYKIGKSVNVKERTRLFAVKLPFPISVEHYAWFEDYSHAERNFHHMFHTKRLEGEWFNLDAVDLDRIKSMGKSVPLHGL